MTVERTYHCDGPDCEHHGSDQYPGWVLVTEHSSHPGEPPDEMQFCSWDCVLKYAAKFPPPERIEVGA